MLFLSKKSYEEENELQEVLSIEKELANRYFYPKAMLIAIPIALQQLINSALNMIDTFMVGQLGDAAVAAVGISNQFFFFLLLFLLAKSKAHKIIQGKNNKEQIIHIMLFVLIFDFCSSSSKILLFIVFLQLIKSIIA